MEHLGATTAYRYTFAAELAALTATDAVKSQARKVGQGVKDKVAKMLGQHSTPVEGIDRIDTYGGTGTGRAEYQSVFFTVQYAFPEHNRLRKKGDGNGRWHMEGLKEEAVTALAVLHYNEAVHPPRLEVTTSGQVPSKVVEGLSRLGLRR